MTPDQIKAIVDEVFAALEAATAARPVLNIAVLLLHKMVDAALIARVAQKVGAPK